MTTQALARYGADSGSALARVVDLISDVAVVAFAVWTLLAYVTSLAQLPVTPVVVVWLVTLPALGFAGWRWRQAPAASPSAGWLPSRRTWAVAGLAVGAAAAISWASGPAWWVGWTLAAIGTAIAVADDVRKARRADPVTGLPETSPPGTGSAGSVSRWPLVHDALALAMSAGCGLFTLFVLRPNGDDAFYVNRATYVEQIGRIPYRDVLISNHTLPPVGGTGAPVDAIGPLAGALARLFHVNGAGFMWLVVPPVAITLGVWALWRLIRSWAPRAPLAALAVTLALYFAAGGNQLSFGSFWLTRAWQGKVVLVSWLFPALLVLLTDYVRRPDRRRAFLLYTAGVAAIGLSTTATLDVPLLVAAGVAALLVARQIRPAIVVAGSAAFPFIVGFAATRWAPPGPILANNVVPPEQAAHDVITTGVVAFLAGVGLWAGHRVLRDPAARRIALALAVTVTLVLGPGVMAAASDVLGVGGVLRRILFITPVAALAGIVVATIGARIGDTLSGWLRPLATAAAAMAAAGAVLAGGTPIWSSGLAQVVDHPTWKMLPLREAQALAIARHTSGREVVLAPQVTMSGLALVSARARAVDPRFFYTDLIPQPAADLDARHLLDRVVSRGLAPGADTEFAAALQRLDVRVVCLARRPTRVLAELRRLGYQRAFAPPLLTCYDRAGAPTG